jgi:hypothetical protein
MKFLKNFLKNTFLTLALLSLVFSSINTASIKSLESKNAEKEDSLRHKAKLKHIFRPQINPPIKEKQKLNLGVTFGSAINDSAHAVNLQDFKSVNLDSKFHALFDKQLEEIFIIFKKRKLAGVTDFRSSYALFINYFNGCDSDGDLYLNKEEFGNCMDKDPYLSLIQKPEKIYSTMKNFTNASNYNDDLFGFVSNYDLNKINFYDYVILRLFAFSWRKCTIANAFMDEVTFECAYEIISGSKNLNTNTLRSIFQLGISLVNTKSMPVRTLDFMTYFALASSIKLFGRINARNNFDANLAEFNMALDTNTLPTRYNQDIINQLFRLTKKDSSATHGIDVFSFVYYDHFLKLFYQGESATKRWTITSKEFSTICSHWLFPEPIFNNMKHVPTANITSPNYNLRAHIKDNQLDESDNFSKFLELSSKNTKANLQRYTVEVANQTVIDDRIFKLLDSNNNNYLTFYDFGNFIQTFFLYQKTDSRDADRVIVSDIYTAFTEYSDLPMISTEFRTRSKRFSLIEQDLYIDPFYTLAVTRMDDYVHHFLRRADPTTVKEVELNLIFDRINLKNQ